MSQAASRSIDTREDQPANVAPVNGARSMELSDVYRPIEKDLREVEMILRNELQSETPFVDQLLEHSWLMGGKRIRPVFLLLAAAACGKVSAQHHQLAAALEMIHTATLIHDDVLDDAKVRRHRATANSQWDNKVSVLLGDYLFTNSFHVASLAGSAEALQMLAQASNRVCEGEMRQNAWKGNFDLKEADYLKMISEKTAELCGVGCRIGAFLSGANETTVDQFEAYGRHLGVAFQIIDDVLDIVGDQTQVGKTLGTDLANQKPTLPIIHCLENIGNEAEQLKLLLTDPGSTIDDVLPLLNRTQSLQYARDVAQQQAQAANSFAESLPANPFSAALQHLSMFVLKRTH